MLHLSSLSPFGPIFGKELRTTARRKRSYVLRFIYLALLLLVLLWAYAITRRIDFDGGVAARTQALNRMGELFLNVFAWFTLIAMVAIGPILTATALSEERLRKTLPVLLMTPINAWQIVAGKLLSRVWIAITLLGLSLPVLAVARLLGGVEIEQMAAVLAICFTTVLFAAAVGLFFSTFMNRAYANILLSYAALLLLYVVVAMIVSALMYSSIRSSPGRMGSMAAFGRFLMYTNPAFALTIVIHGQAGGGFPGVAASDWWHFAVTHLVMASVLVLFSSLILRRTARKLAQGGGAAAPLPEPTWWPAALPPLPPLPTELPPLPNGAVAQPVAPPPAPVPVAMGAAWEPLPARASRDISDRPVLWRELRRPLMSKRWQRIVGALCFVGLLLLSYALISDIDGGSRDGLLNSRVQAVYACVFCGMLTISVCVLAGTTIAHEKETDTWTLLLATPLSGSAIVWGKVLGLMRRLLWPTVLMLAHLLLFTICGAISMGAFVLAVWVMVTFNSLFVATGTWLSLRLRKVTFAVILNLLVPITIYALAPIVLAILEEFVLAGHDLPELCLAWMPYSYLGEGMHHLSRPQAHEYYLRGGRGDLNFGPFGWVTTSEFWLIALGIGCAYLVVSGLILLGTILHFDRIVGRAPQRLPIGELRPLAQA